MKKLITNKGLVMMLLLMGVSFGVNAQGTANRVSTSTLTHTNTTEVNKQSVYHMSITCSDGQEAKYLNWLKEMDLSNSVIESIAVDSKTNSFSVTLEGIGGEFRSSTIKTQLDQYLQTRAVKEQAAKSSDPIDAKSGTDPTSRSSNNSHR